MHISQSESQRTSAGHHEGVVGDEAAHFIEKLADRDFLARQLRHLLVPAEDGERRANGRDEEVGPTDALRPEEVEAFFGNLLEFLGRFGSGLTASTGGEPIGTAT